MTVRVEKLRKISLETEPSVSHERAVLITEFHKGQDTFTVAPPMRRALAFKYLM